MAFLLFTDYGYVPLRPSIRDFNTLAKKKENEQAKCRELGNRR